MKNKLRINAAVTTVAVIICVILLNLVAGALSSKLSLKLDLTREKVYEFSEQTKDLISNLDESVHVYALYPDDIAGDYVEYVKEYLSKYCSLSDKFTVSYVDPYSDPTSVSKFTSDGDSVNVGSIVVTCGDRFKVITFDDLYDEVEETNAISIDMERKVTSAVMNVTNSGKDIKVYFTSGHGESTATNFMKVLSDDGFVCEETNISLSEIPSDASVLVITDPSNDFSLDEINKIDKFSDNGGHVIIAVQSGKDIPSNVESYLDYWGVKIEHDFVVEGDSKHAFQSQYGVSVPAPIMQYHSITENLINQKIEYMAPMARSITLHKNNVYGAVHTPLLVTSENSWGKVNLNSDTLEREEDDNIGPLNIAVLSERLQSSNKTSRLFVIGSFSSVDSSAVVTQSSYANSDFLLNTVSYMTGRNSVLNIRAKKVSPETLTMSESQVKFITVLLLYLIPGLILVLGVIIWCRRRYL